MSTPSDTPIREHTIREALLAMGYVERKPGRWFKPVGYQCLTYHEERNELCNWFVGADNQLHCWETKKLEPGRPGRSYLWQVKEFEATTRLDIYTWAGVEANFANVAIDI